GKDGCSRWNTANHAIATIATASTRSKATINRRAFGGAALTTPERMVCTSPASQTARWIAANTTTMAFHAVEGHNGQLARISSQYNASIRRTNCGGNRRLTHEPSGLFHFSRSFHDDR